MTKKALKICLACFAGFLIMLFVFGPREPVRLSTGHDKFMIGDDIDAYLAMREGQFDDIMDDVEKQVRQIFRAFLFTYHSSLLKGLPWRGSSFRQP